MQLSDFSFDLPDNLIAVEPLPRGTSRLLYVPRNGNFKDMKISDLPKLLRPNDLLVFNNTKVLPARLKGFADGRKAQITLHKNLTTKDDPVYENIQKWSAFCKPSKKFSANSVFDIDEDFSAKVDTILEGGEIIFNFPYSRADFVAKLSQYGKMPLPPYISKKRAEDKSDEHSYQTIYADEQKQGSVAAPTAGLHFTNEIMDSIKERGADTAFVTLHVGGGTFLPVKSEDIAQHKMHSEYYEISDAAAEKINNVKRAGGRIIAVGTTSLRTLESAADENGILQNLCGDTRIFIRPTTIHAQHRFKICDALFTNFHLPKSTLFMLVSAITSLPKAQASYRHAINKEYRFFSYGDACFFEIN